MWRDYSWHIARLHKQPVKDAVMARFPDYSLDAEDGAVGELWLAPEMFCALTLEIESTNALRISGDDRWERLYRVWEWILVDAATRMKTLHSIELMYGVRGARTYAIHVVDENDPEGHWKMDPVT